MSKQIKVLHILTGFGMGGAETWLLELVKFIKNNPEYNSRLHLEFLLTGGKKEVLDDQFEALGIKLYYIPFSLGNIFSFRRAFIKLLKAENYDALHSHQDFVSGWLFALGSGHLPKIRISYLHNSFRTIGNYLSKPHRYITFYLGKYLMYFFSTHISGTSKNVMMDYGYYKYPFIKKNIGPIYCGFDPSKFLLDRTLAREQLNAELHWEDGKLKIALFVGRLDLGDEYGASVNPKNPKFANEIAVELVNKNPEWRFLFVGKKGNIGAALEKDSAAMKLQDKIKFLDIRNDVAAIMNASDILVFPSLWEGLGMVAVEAQASGLPVLVSENVPLESCVIKELYHRQSLQLPAGDWVNKIESVTQKQVYNKSKANMEIYNSGFSIQNSLLNLIKIYE